MFYFEYEKVGRFVARIEADTLEEARELFSAGEFEEDFLEGDIRLIHVGGGVSNV